jgi:hypothetical protein
VWHCGDKAHAGVTSRALEAVSTFFEAASKYNNYAICCCCCPGKKQLVRNSKDAWIITAPFIFWALMVILTYVLTVIKLNAVSRLASCQLGSHHLFTQFF